MPQKFPLKAAIFDFDGTLGDSMWVWDEVDREFARRRNLEFGQEEAVTIASLGFEGTAAYLLEHFGLDETVEDLIAEWYSIAMDKYAHEVVLKPGAAEYLRNLKEQGVPMGVATSLRRTLLEPALKNNEVIDLFDAIVVCEEIGDQGKRTPAVYLETAKLMGVDLADCVVFEDVVAAAQSAKQGGAHVVGVVDNNKQQDFAALEEAVDFLISDFEDLL